ncbi:MAG: hypothetical protein ABR953_15015 [Candidatus Acidiferrales bacterium]|jgi:hypothetical protein
MTKLEAAQQLQSVILEIECELELTPGMVDRVMLRESLYPGDPLAKQMVKLICARLDPEAQFLLAELRPAEC